MIKVPSFDTPRLHLRELVQSDAPAYERYFVDYNVIRHLSAAVPWPYPANGVHQYIQNEIIPHQGCDRWVWAINLKENPTELIGVVDLWRHGKPENRGFWLAHKYWGNGYMTEAVTPVLDFAFDQLGFERLIFTNAAGNRRSGRIKDKTGARLIKREPASFVDPSLTELEVYELTKSEWREFKDRSSGAG